ncbi:FMRFamide receptor-like [Biomphalaria glabrata]|uniref:FMRFamide receptor-like n=1 Tax=Biomphalaria glabrata TaxID=6526 RepID=A0A9U8EFY1_BIOGL|nr:FMRFamide receptor-like [Biomphalaria glabrata]
MANITDGGLLLTGTDNTFNAMTIDAQVYNWFLIVDGFLLGLVSLLGIIFNTVNVIVYSKMSQRDSVNIALLALSLAELGGSVVLLLMSCFSVPELTLGYLPAVYQISWLHIIFSRISSCLTAFVTLERYLCVAMPLKVKALITSGRTIAVVTIIFVGMTSCMVPPFFARKIESMVISDTNRTMLIFIPMDESSKNMENTSVTVNNVALLLAFAVVFISTMLLVITLRKKSKWRSEVTSSLQGDVTSVRDQKVIKMIILIAVIFIVSYLPVVVSTAAMLSVPEYNVEGNYTRIFTLTWGITFLLEGANATASIFVYLKMSSRYKSILLTLLKFNSHGGLTRFH